MGTIPTLQTAGGSDWSRGRQTHKVIWVIKQGKCQERIFRETKPTKEVDDDKKIFKDKMTLRTEFEG